MQIDRSQNPIRLLALVLASVLAIPISSFAGTLAAASDREWYAPAHFVYWSSYGYQHERETPKVGTFDEAYNAAVSGLLAYTAERRWWGRVTTGTQRVCPTRSEADCYDHQYSCSYTGELLSMDVFQVHEQSWMRFKTYVPKTRTVMSCSMIPARVQEYLNDEDYVNVVGYKGCPDRGYEYVSAADNSPLCKRWSRAASPDPKHSCNPVGFPTGYKREAATDLNFFGSSAGFSVDRTYSSALERWEFRRPSVRRVEPITELYLGFPLRYNFVRATSDYDGYNTLGTYQDTFDIYGLLGVNGRVYNATTGFQSGTTKIDELSFDASSIKVRQDGRYYISTLDANGTETAWTSHAPNGFAVRFHGVGSPGLAACVAKTGGSAGAMSCMEDPFGRAVAMYGNARVDSLIDSAGRTVRYEYHPSRGTMTAVVHEDGTRRVYDYVLPTETLGGGVYNSLGLLKTVTDEAGQVIRTYDYDYQNRVRRELNSPTTWLEFTYNGNQVVYKEVDGAGAILSERTLNFTMQSNRAMTLTSATQPAGSGCAASSAASTYDANAAESSRTDYAGRKSCMANDSVRGLEVARIDGFAAADACPANVLTAAPTATQRKVSTQWHPDWRLETKVAEPGRVTTKVYNGQPDPFAGNAVASCAPASAVLPDGKPIVVLCKEVQQATSDTTGAQGLSPTLTAGVAARTQSWTYNQYGQVLTHDGPRTDVSDVTTYTYYTSTDADWTMGDLQQVTNAAGQITRFPKYNKAGKVLQMIDANGIVTDYSYDARQRLKSVTTAGATTSYDYHPTGLLKQVTEPDASWVGYEYDTAQRLVAIKDHRGNRIDYTLDHNGNRTNERVSDPQGALQRSAQRSFDALGRLQQLTGRE